MHFSEYRHARVTKRCSNCTQRNNRSCSKTADLIKDTYPPSLHTRRANFVRFVWTGWCLFSGHWLWESLPHSGRGKDNICFRNHLHSWPKYSYSFAQFFLRTRNRWLWHWEWSHQTWFPDFYFFMLWINPLLPESDLKILIRLTPDHFTCQRETP